MTMVQTSNFNQTAYTLANAAQLATEIVMSLQGQNTKGMVSETYFTRTSLYSMALAGLREKVAA